MNCDDRGCGGGECGRDQEAAAVSAQQTQGHHNADVGVDREDNGAAGQGLYTMAAGGV